MYIEIPLPIKGLSEGLVPYQEAEFTGYTLNVRPRDTLEKRIRLGQRPALIKAYTEQVGSSVTPVNPIVQLFSVTSMD